MTWVIGIPTSFGAAILVSDICVTFDRGDTKEYYDGLQKIYPVGRYILAGFSGSVGIGFRLIERLQYELAKAPPDHAWSLSQIAHRWWPRLARREFAAAEKREQKLGSGLLLASVHPTAQTADVGWPVTEVFRFRAPSYAPEKALPNTALSIGSDVSEHTREIVEYCDSDVFVYVALQGGATSLGRNVAHVMGELLSNSPVPAVSTKFQVGVVMRGAIEIVNHNYMSFFPGGATSVISLPELARSYAEFQGICDDIGLSCSTAKG